MTTNSTIPTPETDAYLAKYDHQEPISEFTKRIERKLIASLAENKQYFKELNDADATVGEFKLHLNNALAENQKRADRIKELEKMEELINKYFPGPFTKLNETLELVTQLQASEAKLRDGLEKLMTGIDINITGVHNAGYRGWLKIAISNILEGK